MVSRCKLCSDMAGRGGFGKACYFMFGQRMAGRLCWGKLCCGKLG